MPSTDPLDPTNYTTLIPPGNPVWHDGTGSLTYSLLTTFPDYYRSGNFYSVDGTLFSQDADPSLTATQQAQATLAVARYNEVANLNITLASSGVGDITFGALSFSDPGLFGFAYYPGIDGLNGDVWLNNTMGIVATPTLYDEGWVTVIHELGHALGLDHPFDNVILPTVLDNSRYTVMSYDPVPEQANVADPEQQWPATPMLYDIQALQVMYGANTATRTGNDVYFTNSGVSGMAIPDSGTLIATIWDAGGIDTFSGIHQTSKVTIDLRPGHFSSIGSIANNIGIAMGIEGTTARSAWIENAVGGSAGDSLTGNGLANVLDGRAGADTMNGQGGDDIYYVDNINDRVIEALAGGTDTVRTSVSFGLAIDASVEVLMTLSSAGVTNLRLIGSGLPQRIIGNAGANIIDGRGGADTMQGGLGEDTYYVDNANDRVIEAVQEFGLRDTVRTSVSYTLQADSLVDILRTTDDAGTTAINLTGAALAEKIFGNAGSNRINGGAGADTMYGGGGSDTYVVDNAGDVIIEAVGVGYDRVEALVSHRLTAGQAVEYILAADRAGVSNLNLTGNEFAQLLQGNAGINTLDGRGGADTMTGYGGNDIYIVDAAGDVVIELAGQGSDTVRASVSWVLSAGMEIETLVTNDLRGLAAINLTGNQLAQTLQGNDGVNVLNGGGGDDLLRGNGGADTFAFTTAPSANGDVILDFVHGTDKIAVDNATFAALGNQTGALSANAFALASAVATAATRIVYNAATGAILYDADGLGGGAPVKFASVNPGVVLTASDFLVF